MSFPLEFFNYKKGILTSNHVSLCEIAEKMGTPVYVYSAEAFLNPFKTLQKGLSNLDHLICFALKSNSNIAILTLLGNAGAGMDLVSGGELFRANAAKIPADRIVFSGVGKTPAEMEKALHFQEKGIFSFNVESLNELFTLNQVALNANRKAQVALRFNPDVDAKTHPYISTGLKKNKFGMDRSEILKVIHQINDLHGITLKGISIHIGSQLLSLRPLDDSFLKLKKLIDEINFKLSTPLSFIDLGGGLGITYKNEQVPSVDQYCKLIQKHFGKKSNLKYPLKILVEPGRMLSGNSGVLLTRIQYRKTRKQKDFLILDAGMNDLIRPALYESYHEIVPVKKRPNRDRTKKTNLVGPVCESADCFSSGRPLSEKLKTGDLLAILSAGAYGFSMASNYNSRPRPAEVLIQNKEFRTIREREKDEDLIRGESL